MARYRFLLPHYVNDFYFEAGDTASTADVGGRLPQGWRPSGSCEPLDADAVRAFFAAGPQRLAVDPRVAKPKTYWREVGDRLWELLGHESLGRIGA